MDLAAGATIASVTLVEPIAQGDRIDCWRGKWPDGSAGTVHVLKPTAGERERDNFLGGARKLAAAMRARRLPGVVPVAAVVPTAGAYVTRQSAAGTMADVPVLEWDIANTVKFMRLLCRALDTVHSSGLAHGCLCPGNVLLDDDLAPRLADVGMLVIDDSYEGSSDMKHDYSAYAARELRIGHEATARADVFSVGRLLYFLLDGATPDEPDEDLPLLAKLEDAEPGLVRIIRRCTTRDLEQRYGSVDAILDDLERYDQPLRVGVAHPHGRERVDEGETPESGRDSSRAPDSVRPSESQRSGRSVRPPGSTRNGAARRPAAPEAKEEPKPAFITYAGPDVGDDEDILTPRQARVGAIVGVLALAGALAFAFFRGEAPVAVVAGCVVGAILISLLVPSLGGAPLVTRVVAALIFGTAAWMIDPGTVVAEAGREAKFSKGSPQQRGARVKQLYDRGKKNFDRVDLGMADFQGMDLSGAQFDGTRLVSARFDGGKLTGASFAEADITGCNFSNADLTDISVTTSVGWDQTVCSSGTVMPEGWTCTDNKPKSRSSFGMTGVEQE
ncbi:MAG: pentapeptide repeat-containing protein [Deltaproteobacteria bacterium]|nr:pentapeptide repeat-containing protein [Deltaproteobacteria bacterium]